MLPRQFFLRFTVCAILGAGLAAPVAARVTCCEIDGKRNCGDPPPSQCLGKAKTVFDKGVAKEIEAPLTVEQRAARDIEVARRAEEEKRIAEQARRDRALLDSYASEKDIDLALDRALAEIEKNTADAQVRLDTALKKKQALDQEKEFYLKKPMPVRLELQVKDNESEIAAQQKALQQKGMAIEAVNARFEADKARYRILMKAGVK